jgi:hypothetical protein
MPIACFSILLFLALCTGLSAVTPSFTPTDQPTATATVTDLPTFTHTPSITLTPTPTGSATSTFTSTISPTHSHSPTITETSTITQTHTNTSTYTITQTCTITMTPTPPASFEMPAVIPNPAKGPSMAFHVRVPQQGELRLRIYTVSGKLVQELVWETLHGEYEMAWDMKNKQGTPVANGTYYVVGTYKSPLRTERQGRWFSVRR